MQAYLTFNGNAAEALAFYAKALGGKVVFSMSFGESPMGAETPAAYKDKIMHATLEARGHQLMASDMPPGMPFEGHKGFSLSVDGNTVEEGKKLFDALAEGGEVTMPFGPQFWPRASAC
jgi:PhnB protein